MLWLDQQDEEERKRFYKARVVPHRTTLIFPVNLSNPLSHGSDNPGSHIIFAPLNDLLT